MRVLYVEDEKFLAEAVIHLLRKAKINVDWVDDGEAGLEQALKAQYDCVVLDIMLPKLSGLDILKTMRAQNVTTPVIMLSALNEVEDKVNGLELGADDYLAKPFKTAELIARINAVTRRPKLIEKNCLEFKDLTLDISNHLLNEVALTDKEFEILEMLMKSPGVAVTKTQILARVWGEESELDENYVEVYISYLRKKIIEAGSTTKIKAIRGLGYKLYMEETDV